MSKRWLTEAEFDSFLEKKHAPGRLVVPFSGGSAADPIPAKPALVRPVKRATRSKYGNEPQIVDGMRMASKREAKRYRELGLQLKCGLIDFLARQVRFRLPGGIEYVADFLYGKVYANNLVVEDAKGVKTAEYKLKKKLMLSMHGIKIVET